MTITFGNYHEYKALTAHLKTQHDVIKTCELWIEKYDHVLSPAARRYLERGLKKYKTDVIGCWYTFQKTMATFIGYKSERTVGIAERELEGLGVIDRIEQRSKRTGRKTANLIILKPFIDDIEIKSDEKSVENSVEVEPQNPCESKGESVKNDQDRSSFIKKPLSIKRFYIKRINKRIREDKPKTEIKPFKGRFNINPLTKQVLDKFGLDDNYKIQLNDRFVAFLCNQKIKLKDALEPLEKAIQGFVWQIKNRRIHTSEMGMFYGVLSNTYFDHLIQEDLREKRIKKKMWEELAANDVWD